MKGDKDINKIVTTYRYTVERDVNSVYYTIFRDDVTVTRNIVNEYDLGGIIGLFYAMFVNDEKTLRRLMQQAHIIAQYAIETLVLHDKK